MSGAPREQSTSQAVSVPSLSLKEFRKATLIDRTIQSWALISLLWLIFTPLGILGSWGRIGNLSEAVSKLTEIDLNSVQPQFQEKVARLQAHSSALTALPVAMYLACLVSVGCWIATFYIRRNLWARKREVRVLLLAMLGAISVATLIVAAVTLPLPAAEMQEILGVNVYSTWAAPVVFLLMMLTVLPLFGETAERYFSYVAQDRDTFSRQDAVRKLLRPDAWQTYQNLLAARCSRAWLAWTSYLIVLGLLVGCRMAGIQFAHPLQLLALVVLTGVTLWGIAESVLLTAGVNGSWILVLLLGLISWGMLCVVAIPVLARRARHVLNPLPTPTGGD